MSNALRARYSLLGLAGLSAAGAVLAQSASPARPAAELVQIAGQPEVVAVNGCSNGSQPGTLVVPAAGDGADNSPEATIRRLLDRAVGELVYDKLPPARQQMLLRLAERGPITGTPVQACFAEGSDENEIKAFNAALWGFQPRFNSTSRWGATALNPGGTQTPGDPTTLTYSFVPDGTLIPSGVGEPAANSTLFAWLDGLYGGSAAWQALFAQVFTRWSDLIGVTYVFQPTDDGVDMFGNQGVAGVRGDLRIGAKFIDGNSGILAYNFFPQGGDMVLDAFDTFYNTTTNNSLRLRNVVAHEHGHGMGQLHVCPINQTKLMEPTVSTLYDGPRHDDIRHGHELYGDPNEPNDTSGQATPLGALANAATLNVGAITNPALPNATLLSLDSGNDTDVYSFSVSQARALTVVLTPTGAIYADSIQSGGSCGAFSASCCLDGVTDSLSITDFQIEVLSTNGTTVLRSRNARPAGQEERLLVRLPAAGTYFLRVTPVGVANSEPNSYALALTTSQVATEFASGAAPAAFAPGVATNVDIISVSATAASANLATSVLDYRPDGVAPFTPVTFTALGSDTYRATVPGFSCTDTPQIRVTMNYTGSSQVIPTVGAFAVPTGTLVTLASDDMEGGSGAWTTGGAATAGQWLNAVPVATPAQAEFDTTIGGDRAWITGLPAGGLPTSTGGDGDVDGGSVILTSPNFDLSNAKSATLSYNRWFSNGTSGTYTSDTMVIETSTNGGGSWANLETLGPGSNTDPNVQPQWIGVSRSFAGPYNNQFRMRFTVTDAGSGTIVEGAVDDLLITGVRCTPPAGCDPIDFNGDGVFPDNQDITDFILVFGGSPCPTGTCNDIDFNNDGVFPDNQDIIDFINAFAGQPC